MARRIKTENHHWWPRSLSRFWADDAGLVSRISPDGSIVKAPPEHFGSIRNGHHIKHGRIAGDESPWDSSFESEFDKADSIFPDLVSWLMTIEHLAAPHSLADEYIEQDVSDQKLKQLTECVTSLAVRSPRNRESAVDFAQEIRGELQKSEKNALIGYSLRNQ